MVYYACPRCSCEMLSARVRHEHGECIQRLACAECEYVFDVLDAKWGMLGKEPSSRSFWRDLGIKDPSVDLEEGGT